MATGQTENFPVYPKHSRAARFAKKGAKKTANLFQTYCFCWLPVAAGYSVFMVCPADRQAGT